VHVRVRYVFTFNLIYKKMDITWKMNDISNSMNKFLNLINLHLLWHLFLKLNTITQKITNNTMSIVIEFIANTNYEIHIWINKTCCKLYIHKIKKAQNIKSPKKSESSKC
jgi:hypothetical protein